MATKMDKTSDAVPPSNIFKRCSKCHHPWISRDLFLQDPELEIVGYQANFVKLELGLFLFTHSCGTTMSIWAKDFVDLFHGTIYTEHAIGSDQCPGYCLQQEELRPCSVHCEYAYVREIVGIIKSWPKQDAPLP